MAGSWDKFIRFQNCTDIQIRNLQFDNWRIDQFGGVELYDCQRWWVDSCHFYNSDVTSNPGDKDRLCLIAYESTAGNNDQSDCWFTNNVVSDLAVNIHCAKRVHIEGNTVSRSPVTGGIVCCAFNVNGSTLEDYWICNNLVIDPDGAGIYVVLDGTQKDDTTYRGLHINNNRVKLGLVPDALNGTQISSRAIYIGAGNNGVATTGNVLHDFEVCGNTVWVTRPAASLAVTNGILINNSVAANWDIRRGRIEGNLLYGNGTGTAVEARLCSDVVVVDNEAIDWSVGFLVEMGSGDRVEENRSGATNLFSSPVAPATQELSLAVGSYRVWLVGAGSVTAAAHTAVGSGFAAATGAAPITIVVTTAGTVTFTVAGVVTRAGVEMLTTTAFSLAFASSTGDNVVRNNRVLGSPVNGYAITGSPLASDHVQQEIFTPSTVAAGDLLYGSAAGTLSALAVGSAGKVVRSNGTLPVYSSATYPDTFAAGDLPYATAANAVGALGIGAANRVLTSTGSAPQWSANLAAAALPVGASSFVTWDVGAGSTLMLTRQTRVNAPLALGNTPDASVAFRANLMLTGGVNQVGIFSDSTPGSDATASFYAHDVLPRTAVASYTTATVAGVRVRDAAKGANSTITTLIGVDIANQTAGGANYSIRTGTAECRFGGAGIFGANATTPSPAAVLQLESTTQGLLLPRMTTTQRDAISSPPDGLVIYNSTVPAVQARVGGAWVSL
ncbi:hypothetical protein SAMN05216486_10165 [bacterium JGI 053]|nr:hypothetical protein SAMN05216486_10165 [bacterium JGI 053]